MKCIVIDGNLSVISFSAYSIYLTEYFDEFGEGNIYLTKSVHIDKQRDGKYAYVLKEDNEELLFDFKDGLIC